ncbi:MAG: hypothetical protein ABSF09_04670 [Candidatus Bathyarchaeia archaeon]|jgi:hypothetical protein
MRSKQLFSIILTINILAALVGFSPVYSQTACHFSFFRPDHPDSTPAGQPFQVRTTVTVICDGAFDPSTDIRVDLTNGQNQTVISRSVYTSLTQPVITTTLVNTATAPLDTGTWVLQANAYVIGRPSGTALASSQQLFSVNVVPYTPTTATSSISLATTTTSSVTTTSITPTTSQQVVVIPTRTSTTTSTENTPQNTSTYYRIIAFIALIVILIGIVIAKRKKREAKDKTQVY